jgi:hypothetical protein
MALKICKRGHLTGTVECWCGEMTIAVKGPSPKPALSNKEKRRITQSIREAGGVPVADLGR